MIDFAIDLIKINLADITAFTLIAVSFLSQIIKSRGFSKNTLLTNNLVKNESKKLAAEYIKIQAECDRITAENKRIVTTNKELTERLDSLESDYKRLKTAYLITLSEEDSNSE